MKCEPSKDMLRIALSYLEHTNGLPSIATLAYPNRTFTSQDIQSMDFQECVAFLEMCKLTEAELARV